MKAGTRLAKRLFLRAAIGDSLALSAARVLNGLLNATIIAFSARQGQTDQIAAYTVVTAALGLVAVVTGGGSSLLYVTGTEKDRRFVRSQRVFIVLPCMVVGIALVTAWYVPRGYQAVALLVVGIVVLGNNVAELQYGDLARQLKFVSSAAVSCGSKLPAIALVAAGVPLTASLAVAAISQFVAAELLLRGSSWISRSGLSQLSKSDARNALMKNRNLFAYSIAELYNGRAPSLVLSMLVTPHIMGCYGVVVNAYQAFGSVSYAALQVRMATKARQRLGLDANAVGSRSAEMLPIAGSIAAAAGVFWLAPWITVSALNLPIGESVMWLRILAVALPLYIVNRSIAMNFIANGSHQEARRTALAITTLLTLSMVVLLPAYGPLGASLATLVAEGLVVVLGFVRYAKRPTTTWRGALARLFRV